MKRCCCWTHHFVHTGLRWGSHNVNFMLYSYFLRSHFNNIHKTTNFCPEKKFLFRRFACCFCPEKPSSLLYQWLYKRRQQKRKRKAVNVNKKRKEKKLNWIWNFFCVLCRKINSTCYSI